MTSASSFLGEDIGAYGGAFKVTEGLQERFGEARVVDTPISETAIVGSAIGASYMGMRPVCEIQFIDFIACCFDMLTNFAATSRYRNGAGVPIVVRGPCGGGVGGGPFHSLNPEAFFLNTPGLKMVEPSTAYDAKGLLKAAIRDDDPVLYFEHKFLYRRIKDEVPEEDYIVPLGKAAIRREGSDLSIITFGAMMHTAMEAAATLSDAGVEAEVLDLRSLAPLDRDAILTTVSKTSRALLLHEARRTGGIGGELAAIIAEDAFEYLDAPVMRVASVDTPVPYSPPLEAAFLPNADKVVAAAQQADRSTDPCTDEESMATNVVMPQMGESIAEGTIVRWIKKVGDAVDRDEPLFEISTDKVDAEIPSPAAGVLSDIKVKEGETVPVNSVVAIIGAAGEKVEPAGSQASATAVAAPEIPTELPEATVGQPDSAPLPRAGGDTATDDAAPKDDDASKEELRRQKSSPLVRRIAKEHNVDIREIQGTGLSGRVTKQDILGYLKSGCRGAGLRGPPQPLRRQVLHSGQARTSR